MFDTFKRFIVGWIVIGFFLSIFFGYQYLVKKERKSGYAQAVAEYTARALIAEKEARERESQWNRQLQEAENAATKRDQQIKTLSTSAAVASGRLRDQTITLRNGLPAASIAACRATANAALTVFGECEVKYRELAEDADGHASDVQTLIEAWPHESN